MELTGTRSLAVWPPRLLEIPGPLAQQSDRVPIVRDKGTPIRAGRAQRLAQATH